MSEPENAAHEPTGPAPEAPDAPTEASPPGETTSEPPPRRQVNILPWAAADTAAEPPADRSRSARRAPVPPSGLVAAPGPGGVDDPFAPLPPWLPPVRRRAPDPRHDGQAPPGRPPWSSSVPGPRPSDGPVRRPEPPGAPFRRRPPHTQPPRLPEPRGGPTRPPLDATDPTGRADLPAPPEAGRHPTLPWQPIRPLSTGRLPMPPPEQAPPRPAPARRRPEPLPGPRALGLEPFGAPAPPAPTALPASTPPIPTPATPAVPLPAAPAAEPPAGTLAPTAAREPAGPPATASPGTVVKPAPAAAPTSLTAAAIGHEQVVRSHGEVPRIGWRAAVYAATCGRINLGVGGAERAHQRLMERVRAPLPGTRHIAVTSIKGGVGKTTVAACLGLMLAEYRGEGVIAVDADPDAGTLADRLSGATTVTVRDLLVDLDEISSLGQFGAYTTLAGRLRVLAGEQDPAMGEAFRREDYQRVCAALARFFDIVITDSGTGLVHSAMRGTLELADTLIVVGTPTVDGASRASKTLDWLQAHGYQRLAEEAVLVLSHDRRSRRVDRKRLREHFRARCGHVIEIPADTHLYSGGLIKPERLAPATGEAFLRLAAVIADGFGAPERPLALPSGRRR